ncbi:major facilitator superfamily transporter [Colletotrichum higginsianum IMI 349063]|uniref:Major facilitator superfamily transporter n=3 Tax=Colletotrichum higginsianum TaxID=80884 RepID=A0A1B7XZT4_COLHI|nr:major facilitator superfamily transporter [Colletotrichum higginsianum IMI 349063]OBR05254.1 major facilitator superfamily transporter [Colletotrichum higginsianum IMI 349063]TIC93513.1 putative MFS-type transporter PB1E7.08c [Colletotrichum higginsianum]
MLDPATQKRPVDTDAPAPVSDIEDSSISSAKDILEHEGEDPVLARKMRLVNDANDQIGWTPFHWKLFVLNGFGYAVDSLIALVQSVTNTGAFLELASSSTYRNAGTISLYVGLLVGAIFWGFGADIIGRRIAFNVTLLITALATIVSGASPNIASWGFFIALSAFGAGGNLVLDPTVFLEFLPSNKQWTVTALALWWGFGQALTGFIAWGFLTQDRWNCTAGQTCNWSNNPGWRYVSFTAGAFVFVTSVARVTIMRLKETPKYLLSVGRDADLVRNYQQIAQKYGGECSLTEEKLAACGKMKNAGQDRHTLKFVLNELVDHVRGLFVTRKMALSTTMVWMSWTLIGLAYPLFYVFLPSYLASRVPNSVETPYETWRNFTLTNISGIPGPIIAGYLANLPHVGRKYTMVIGALLSMALFFAYTAVKTADQNVGLSCAIACCINIYYGTLYAYTVEVFPSAHRATGNGIAVACNRLMGIVSAFVATSGDTTTAVPLYVCAALFGLMAGVSALFPFEPYGRRSS